MTKYSLDFIKDSAATEDYTVDWTSWLGSDTILTSTWSIPSGITKNSDSIDSTNKMATVWLAGGTAPNDYECYNTITTSGGRIERAMIKIQVR